MLYDRIFSNGFDFTISNLQIITRIREDLSTRDVEI